MWQYKNDIHAGTSHAVVMAIVIGFLVVAMYLPMIDMMQTI